MPKRDKLDKSQEEGQGPEELDITQILSEVNDYEELGPDQSAMDAYGMTDPALGDVDRILREVREELGESKEAPRETGEVEDAASGGEFRDQEYRDAFDESFERAFQGEGEEIQEEAEPQPTRRQSRRKKSGRPPMKKKGTGLLGIPHFLSTLILCAIILAVSVTLARVVWLWADDVLALTKEEKVVTVTIADTDTMGEITQKLAQAGLVRYPRLFNFYSDLTGAREKISAGTFKLNCMYDYHALVNALGRSSSDRKVVTVTIPEGYECRQIFELLEKNEVCTAEELRNAAQNGDLGEFWFLKDVKRDGPNCLEGFLFPDTYDFYTSDDPERVLRKLLRNFDYRFDEEMEADLTSLNQWLGEKLAGFGFSEAEIKSRYLSIRDLVTVASMIERETAGSGESGRIASVIYNRLCDPAYPYLNIDATIQYALGERKANLTQADTQIDSPYNTYTNPGLPAGPISNPGLNSLKAALHPEETAYYFYALDEDRTHHFSETLEEHEQFLESLGNGRDDDEETQEP